MLAIKSLFEIEVLKNRGWVIAGLGLTLFGLLLSSWIYFDTLGDLDFSIGNIMSTAIGGEEKMQQRATEFGIKISVYIVWVTFFFSGFIFFQNIFAFMNFAKLKDPRFDFVRLSHVPRFLKLSGVFGIHILFAIMAIVTAWGLLAMCGIQKLEYGIQANLVLLAIISNFYFANIMPFVFLWIFASVINRILPNKMVSIGFYIIFFLGAVYTYFVYTAKVWSLGGLIFPPASVEPLFEPIRKLEEIVPGNTNKFFDINANWLSFEPAIFGLLVCLMIYLASCFLFSINSVKKINRAS